MRGKAVMAAVLTAALVVLLGCHHDKHNLAFTPKEEVVEPPHQARFDDPPSAQFRSKRKAPDEKTLLGRDKMGGPGPLGSPGF